jgi:gamma-glutamylcyclotransferase (GGCT)/AIG2-like uncharacterized protein YtfP
VRDDALGGAAARVIGRGTVRGALYDLGEYPGLVESAGDERVPGLILELDDAAALARLDRYEGVDEGLYVRRRVVVTRDDGTVDEVWIYFYVRSVEGRERIAAWPA